MIYLVRDENECARIRSLGMYKIYTASGYEVWIFDNKDVSVSFILVDKKVL